MCVIINININATGVLLSEVRLWGEAGVNKESDDAKIDCDIYDMEGIIIMHPAFVFLIFEISKNLFIHD